MKNVANVSQIIHKHFESTDFSPIMSPTLILNSLKFSINGTFFFYFPQDQLLHSLSLHISFLVP